MANTKACDVCGARDPSDGLAPMTCLHCDGEIGTICTNCGRAINERSDDQITARYAAVRQLHDLECTREREIE